MFAAHTPAPWGRLWLMVPAGVAVSLLAGWRFGAWGVMLPLALFGAGMAMEGPYSQWVWWIPATSLTGLWMGLGEEGGGPPSGQRAWMLLPALLLAAGLPWTLHYPELVSGVEGQMRAADVEIVQAGRTLNYPAARLAALEGAVASQAKIRQRILPHILPSLLFVWNALLVTAGRSIASRVATVLRWPSLSRAPLRAWRLPDGVLVLLLASLAILAFRWTAWTPTAWTLLLNAGLGYCVQGIAVVESVLLARGVPSPIIVLTMLFVLAVAMPIVFMLTTAVVGLSDVWLDYRRLEPAPDRHSP